MHLAIDPHGSAERTAQSTATDSKRDREARSLKRSCQDFEAIFIQSMFKAMRKSIPDGGLFEQDTAHEIYRDMLDAEVASEISRQQGLGLADQMYRQMEKYLQPPLEPPAREKERQADSTQYASDPER